MPPKRSTKKINKVPRIGLRRNPPRAAARRGQSLLAQSGALKSPATDISPTTSPVVELHGNSVSEALHDAGTSGQQSTTSDLTQQEHKLIRSIITVQKDVSSPSTESPLFEPPNASSPAFRPNLQTEKNQAISKLLNPMHKSPILGEMFGRPGPQLSVQGFNVSWTPPMWDGTESGLLWTKKVASLPVVQDGELKESITTTSMHQSDVPKDVVQDFEKIMASRLPKGLPLSLELLRREDIPRVSQGGQLTMPDLLSPGHQFVSPTSNGPDTTARTARMYPKSSYEERFLSHYNI